MIRIFHANNPLAMLGGEDIDRSLTNHRFIGYVDAEDFEAAFAATQNIDESWVAKLSSPHQVHADFRDGTRSTSVGDVMIGEDGRMVVVAFVGFEDVA